MKFINKGWEKAYKEIKTNSKNAVIKRTMNSAFYQGHLKTLQKKVTTLNSVLEIGGGYGGLCKMVIDAFSPSNYTIVDHPTMLKVARDYLGDSVNYVGVPDIENLFKKRFDLLIATHCLSETPVEYQEHVYENVFPICRKVFIVDDSKGDFNVRLVNSLAIYFDSYSIIDYPNYAKTVLYWGE